MTSSRRILLNALALAGLGLAAAGPLHAQERVRIGFMSPLTGPQAASGIDNRDGAQLAIKALNARAIKVGGKPVQFELDVQDDGADPRQGVQVAQALVDKGLKFVLGPYNSGVTLPASRVFADAGVLVLTVASNPKVTQPAQANLFRIGATDNQLGAKMATYAAQDLKVATVAVIDDRTAYGQGVAQEFIAQAQKLGLKVVAKEFTSDKATDFSAILTGIRGLKPDAVFYGGYSAQAGPMLRQMRSLGLKAPLLGGDGICSSETATLAQMSADLNVYCTQGGALMDRSDRSRAFVERYRAEYKRDPLTYAAAFHDGANLLAAAIEATQSLDPKKLAEHIAKGSHAGVAGDYAYDSRHDLRSSAVTVFTFKGKDVVALKSL
ncbi:ABC-type branched-subunit amino acid transport system substrate-binding protein [Sphaerotilus sulfidivorans]|uniref:ABC-type branched-subunit amino acid transport system substrate-binding protein n=1 Tax=Sphaerotilus sulfidivorans TaxID=639200 RepID=A0A5C1Q448_9BURK|nr:branched-chain amino acid ABC transporter substrate-binding protein [Sphaerotilus sulfidivorans]NZD45181.1 branched-chain amino acid ABC transporter substrate-binding protein [Sphaerotilus sulfidivorans]QEN02331.1 branched-chain amino acid ABC transporter substrate-binding protein [Sphaerotilus sulfidivorans]